MRNDRRPGLATHPHRRARAPPPHARGRPPAHVRRPSDPLIWAGHPASDRWTAPQFGKYFDGALASGGALTILHRAGGRIIGCSRYHDHDPRLGPVEIGYTFLVRDCWGGRYNCEVKRLMLAHAFRFVGTVQFAVAETNLRSRRAVEKIGATLSRDAVAVPRAEQRMPQNRSAPPPRLTGARPPAPLPPRHLERP